MIKILKTLSVILVLYVFIKLVFSQENNYKNLKERKVILQGYIYDYYPGNSRAGGGRFRYFFFYKGKKYPGLSEGYSSKGGVFKELFVNKQFPVVVDSMNLTQNDILLTVSRFSDFGLAFPDSLNWTMNYLH